MRTRHIIVWIMLVHHMSCPSFSCDPLLNTDQSLLSKDGLINKILDLWRDLDENHDKLTANLEQQNLKVQHQLQLNPLCFKMCDDLRKNSVISMEDLQKLRQASAVPVDGLLSLCDGIRDYTLKLQSEQEQFPNLLGFNSLKSQRNTGFVNFAHISKFVHDTDKQLEAFQNQYSEDMKLLLRISAVTLLHYSLFETVSVQALLWQAYKSLGGTLPAFSHPPYCEVLHIPPPISTHAQ